MGGGRTDTISVCPQGRVEEPAGSGLQDLARPHGHINHEGRQQARARVRSTQAGAPGAEPWPALAPLGPPHPWQETNPVGKGSAEPLFVHPTNREQMGCIPPAQRPTSRSASLSSNVCLPFPAAGVPSVHKHASRALKRNLRACHFSVPFTASLGEGAVTAHPHFLVPHTSALSPSCLLLLPGPALVTAINDL